VNRVIAAMGAAGGEPLIALVPTDGPIAFAARVRPRDIGIIHLGQRATIRVTARDSRIFGPLVGHVTRIAGDATSDQRNGERWYDIRIETAAYSLTGPDGRRVTIAADMVAEVSLPGAPRTVLSYVLASIFNASNTAIRAPSR
jgi:adhesin transport system membrane fusion protein